MIIPLDILTDLFSVFNLNFAGIPAFVIALIPFIIGLIAGFLLKKVLKWVIIVGIVIIIIALFGFFGLSIAGLATMTAAALPIILTVSALLIGILPLGLGFIIGAIIGFIFG